MKFHAHGLPAKLLAFFEANPDEELTFADIQAKYGVSIASCSRAVRLLDDAGAVEDRPRHVRKRQVPQRAGVWA